MGYLVCFINSDYCGWRNRRFLLLIYQEIRTEPAWKDRCNTDAIMHLRYIGPYFICTIRILYIQADIMHVFSR